MEADLLHKASVLTGHLLHRKKLDVDVSHGGVYDGAVRHSLGTLSLSGSHHLLLGRLLVKDVSVRVCTLCVFWFSLCELHKNMMINNKTRGAGKL